MNAPVTPPQSAAEAVLLEIISAITDREIRGYTNVLFKPATLTEEQRNETARAVLMFAAVGWASYHNRLHEDRLVRLAVPEARYMGIIPPAKPGELPSKAQRVRAAHAKKKKKPARRKRK